MGEACDEVIDYWFDVLKFPVLRSPKAIANEARAAFLKGKGMRIVATDEREFSFRPAASGNLGDHGGRAKMLSCGRSK